MPMRLVSAGVLALLALSACGQPPPPPPAGTPGAAASSSPATAQARLGALTFERGYPTADTTRKLFDEMDYQRAVQAYLWAYPAVSFESIRLAAKEVYGNDYMDISIADKFVDTKSIYLTANDTTIYAFANVDLGQAGPVVLDIPPGAIVGLIDDFWQRSATDVGLPGPHGDKGGKFLLVPPGYTGQVPSQGYEVRQGTMNNYNIMVRGIVTNLDTDVPNAVERVRKVRIYPLNEAGNPKPNRFTSMSGAAINTLPPDGIEFWVRLSAFINNNPIQERDLFFMAMLKPLGIEKGKPFQPDARQRAVLEEASRVGDAMGRTMLFDAEHRFSGATAIPGDELELGAACESNSSHRHPRPTRRTSALHLRRDLHVARHRCYEGRPWVELHSDVQGQGWEPSGRWQVLPVARPAGCAGGGLLVRDPV